MVAAEQHTGMETLDAKELRMFIAVVRIGSIRGAAEHMNVAPSVVSRQIADTERNIGLPLFERNARGMALTEAGELVLEHSRRVLEESSLLTEQLGLLKGVQQRRVRILCGEGFLADVLEYGLGSFVKVYPDVQYDLQLGSTESVLDGIANGDADIGIAYNPLMDTRVRSLAISRQPLCVVTPPEHPLLKKTSCVSLTVRACPMRFCARGMASRNWSRVLPLIAVLLLPLGGNDINRCSATVCDCWPWHIFSASLCSIHRACAWRGRNTRTVGPAIS